MELPTSESHKSIKDYINNSPPGWETLFESCSAELIQISDIIDGIIKDKGPIVFPLIEEMFNAFYKTPLDKVSVIICGQDCYHSFNNTTNKPTATGSSFGTRKGEKVPPSLQNIFKEIKRSYPDEFTIPTSGDLTNWEIQGVFLLNSCLSVEMGKPLSHCGKFTLWDGFISKVLKAVEQKNPNCIYVLLGKEILKMKKYINENSIVYEVSHPSPYSVKISFEGSGIFKKINKALKKQGKQPIDWNLINKSEEDIKKEEKDIKKSAEKYFGKELTEKELTEKELVKIIEDEKDGEV